jgi:hypothetical protein
MDRSYLPSAKAERSVIDNGGDIASLQVEKPVPAQHIQQQVRVHRARSVSLRYAFFCSSSVSSYDEREREGV